MNKKQKKILLISIGSAAAAVVCAGAVISICHYMVASAGRHILPQEALPQCHTALVLGCSPTVNKKYLNRYFYARVRKAAELYHSGKVKTLLLSGDNGRKDYNEPQEMRKELINLRVPDDAIYCDYAGFRTLDSVIRAESVFGQRKFIIVSQTYHCERAIFLARHLGIECYGAAADIKQLGLKWIIRRQVRECLARIVAVTDIIFNTQPKFHGARIDMNVPQKKDPALP